MNLSTLCGIDICAYCLYSPNDASPWGLAFPRLESNLCWPDSRERREFKKNKKILNQESFLEQHIVKCEKKKGENRENGVDSSDAFDVLLKKWLTTICSLRRSCWSHLGDRQSCERCHWKVGRSRKRIIVHIYVWFWVLIFLLTCMLSSMLWTYIKV